MQSIVMLKTGDVDVIHKITLPFPERGPGEILIKASYLKQDIFNISLGTLSSRSQEVSPYILTLFTGSLCRSQFLRHVSKVCFNTFTDNLCSPFNLFAI